MRTTQAASPIKQTAVTKIRADAKITGRMPPKVRGRAELEKPAGTRTAIGGNSEPTEASTRARGSPRSLPERDVEHPENTPIFYFVYRLSTQVSRHRLGQYFGSKTFARGGFKISGDDTFPIEM